MVPVAGCPLRCDLCSATRLLDLVLNRNQLGIGLFAFNVRLTLCSAGGGGLSFGALDCRPPTREFAGLWRREQLARTCTKPLRKGLDRDRKLVADFDCRGAPRGDI